MEVQWLMGQLVELATVVIILGGAYWAYSQGYLDQIISKINTPRTKPAPKTTKPAPKTTVPKTTIPTGTCRHVAVCPTNKNNVLFQGKCIIPAQYITQLAALNKSHGCNTPTYYDVCQKKCVKSPYVNYARANHTRLRITLA